MNIAQQAMQNYSPVIELAADSGSLSLQFESPHVNWLEQNRIEILCLLFIMRTERRNLLFGNISSAFRHSFCLASVLEGVLYSISLRASNIICIAPHTIQFDTLFGECCSVQSAVQTNAKNECVMQNKFSAQQTADYDLFIYSVHMYVHTNMYTTQHFTQLVFLFVLLLFQFSHVSHSLVSSSEENQTKPSQPTNQVNHPSYSHQTHVHSMRYKTSLHLICLVLLHSIAHS